MVRKNRRDFQRLADLRAEEAGVLAKNRKYQGAYYLAGMAIECALKACVAKQTKRHEFPPGRKYVDEVYSHDLEKLLKQAGLDGYLEVDGNKTPALAANWGVVKEWNVNSRYETSGRKGKEMYAAITGADGVLPWIKLYW